MTKEPGDPARRAEPLSSPSRVGEVGAAPAARVVAEVQPLDVTGVRTVTVGVIAWAVAFLALLPFYGTLRSDDNLWWLWTCAAGFGLGLMGLEYCRRRERRIRHLDREVETSPLGAAGL